MEVKNMSFLDTIKGLSGDTNQMKGFVEGIQSFVSQQGGLSSLKNKFEEHGAGSILQSWISTGPNLPVSTEQIQKVMGNQFLQDTAKKMGIDPTTAAQKMTQMLPMLIDKLSPHGTLPENLDAKTIAAATTSLH